MLFFMLIIILESSNSVYNGIVRNHCSSLKTSINDMLNNPHYNWRNFLCSVAKVFKKLYFKVGKDTGILIIDARSGIKFKTLIVEYLDVSSSQKLEERSTIIKAKICFFKYPGCRKWKVILSTNLELTAMEVLKLYLQRWSIECLFKEIKQYFGYDQSKSSNYYAMVSDLSIRYAFYIMFCSKREETTQQSMM